MPIKKAVEGFKKLGEDVFSDKKTISKGFGSTEYKTTKLKQTLKDIVREATGNENEPMMEEESDSKCKT
jgi:CO/xanthine dehydrogenase FAD-binding subunit